jgi:hypothetical protein
MMASCVYWKLDKQDRNERFEREKANREAEAKKNLEAAAKVDDKAAEVKV